MHPTTLAPEIESTRQALALRRAEHIVRQAERVRELSSCIEDATFAHDELLETIREANQSIGYLHSELRVLTRPAPQPGFLARWWGAASARVLW